MTDKIINEGMRIGGKTVHADNKIDVIYPFTGKVIGTVPAGTADMIVKKYFKRLLKHLLKEKNKSLI